MSTETNYKEKYEQLKNLFDIITDVYNIDVYECTKSSCQRTYVYGPNGHFGRYGNKWYDGGFFICTFCEECYCSEHYDNLVPDKEDRKNNLCPTCGTHMRHLKQFDPNQTIHNH